MLMYWKVKLLPEYLLCTSTQEFFFTFIQQKHNNKIQNGMQSNALNYICKTYQGTKPAACNEADKNLNVCYRN